MCICPWSQWYDDSVSYLVVHCAPFQAGGVTRSPSAMRSAALANNSLGSARGPRVSSGVVSPAVHAPPANEEDLAEVERAKAARTAQLLNKYGQREAEIAQQLESRMSKFDAAPMVSNRSQQLLNADPLQSLRAAKGSGPPELGTW